MSACALFLAGFGVLFCLVLSTGELMDGTVPHPVSLHDFVQSSEYLGSSYVTVTGTYQRDFSMQVEPNPTPSSAPHLIHRYVAFLNKEQGGAVMVKLPEDAESPPSATVTLTGMMWRATPELYTTLPKTVSGVPLCSDRYLEVGAAPIKPLVPLTVAGILAVPLVFYIPAFALSYVIFRKTAAVDPVRRKLLDNTAYVDNGIYATGLFQMGGHLTEHFLHIPVELELADTGAILICANVDASKTDSFYFIPYHTEKRTRVWYACIAPGGVRKLEQGLQYLGWRALPGVRLHYVDGYRGWPLYIILTFGSRSAEEKLQSLLQANERSAGSVGAMH